MSDVIIPQTWFGNNRLIPVRGEDVRIFLLTPLVPEGEESVLEIVPLSRIQALESNRDQVSKALCGKENASPDEVLKAVDQLKSRLAQVERERDSAVADLTVSAECDFCDYKDLFPACGEKNCYSCDKECPCAWCRKGLNGFKWRGVCAENTKEE